MWPGMNAMSQAAAMPAKGEWNLLAIDATGSTINAPQMAGWASTDHQTDSARGMSAIQERKIPPSASDHENSGGRGFNPPTG